MTAVLSSDSATRPTPTGATPRLVTIRADLLPPEIRAARRVVVVRKQVMYALALVIVLLGAWYAVAKWQTANANSDLADAQQQSIALQGQQASFGPLVRVQTQAGAIRTRLGALMAQDLQWADLTNRIRGAAPGGVALTTVTGSMGSAAPAAPAAGSITAAAPTGVGTLVLSGTAGSKTAVATYADRLSRIKGLTSVMITSIAATGRSYTFSVGAVIAPTALGGRYAATSPATGTPTTDPAGH